MTTCKSNLDTLIDFYFGAIEQKQRLEMEHHLETCQSCLREFFLLKEDIQASGRENERPSLAIRKDLFMRARAYLRFLSIKDNKQISVQKVYWLSVGGVAVAASALLVFFINKQVDFHQPKSASPASAEQETTSRELDGVQVDTGRLVPENLKFL